MDGAPAPRLPVLRASPEDFRVDELLAYEPGGEGGHTYLHIEKRLRETDEVARWLAREAGVRPGDVGFAGRKDRRAVTRQWFSVPGLAVEAAMALSATGIRVIEAIPHGHKLRVGKLRGNRFELVVREVDDAHFERLEAEAERIRALGLANRFGEQRFGRGGHNVERAVALVAGRIRERDRRKARFLYSALQSHVFNAVLDARPLPLHRLELGDVAQVVASGGSFIVEDLEREQQRADAFEISPTGPLIGPKAMLPAGEVAVRERSVIESLGLDGVTSPTGVRARGGRRVLRVPVNDLTWSRDGDDVQLAFELPSGSYATVLVEALLGEVVVGDEPRGADSRVAGGGDAGDQE
jgi:tRNA pseudouridine13 synthase